MSTDERDAAGLHRFGVAPPTVLRAPATDADGHHVCPEDGQPVERSFGQQRIRHPDVFPEDVAEQPDSVVTFGWSCDRHAYDVVLPVRASDDRAPSDGWAPVRVGLAGERIRAIAVPAAEVDDAE